MSTDTPTPEEGQTPDEAAAAPEEAAAPEAAAAAPEEAAPTPEEELQAATPEAPASEPVAAEEPAAAADGEEAPAEGGDSDLPELTLGDGAPAEEEAPKEPTIVRGKIDKDGTAIGTGRRKTSVARVRIKEGDGQFVVNGRPMEEFFCVERDRKMVQAPLVATESKGTVDVWVRVNGGGTTGQTGAVVLGIARALEARNPSNHHKLAEGGFLTRDGRMVERKKYGKRKARRSFQFSKR